MTRRPTRRPPSPGEPLDTEGDSIAAAIRPYLPGMVRTIVLAGQPKTEVNPSTGENVETPGSVPAAQVGIELFLRFAEPVGKGARLLREIAKIRESD